MKRSFSLIETLISIILLSIVISGFLNLSLQNVDYKNHISLQNLKNKIASNEFSNFTKTKVDAVFNMEDNSTLNFIDGTTYTKYTYEKDFKLLYHDVAFKQAELMSKTFE